MAKSAEDLIRELEAGGVLGGSSMPSKATRRAAQRTGGPASPASKQSGVLFVVLAAIVIAAVGSLPLGSYALYPFSLFVTLVHESCHAVAALISGGAVDSLRISGDLSGVTMIAGGSEALIAPAGYVGASVVGSLLLITPPRYARAAVAALVAVPLAGLLLFHPATLFTAIWCLAFLAGLGLAAWKLPDRLMHFFQILLGVSCGLNAFRDLMTLFFISSSGAHIHTDAELMFSVLPLPATAWAVLWTLLSLALLGGALFTLVKRDLKSWRATAPTNGASFST
jgi:hypothetical protein